MLPRPVNDHQILLTFLHASLHPCYTESTPAILGNLPLCTHCRLALTCPFTIYSSGNNYFTHTKTPKRYKYIYGFTLNQETTFGWWHWAISRSKVYLLSRTNLIEIRSKEIDFPQPPNIWEYFVQNSFIFLLPSCAYSSFHAINENSWLFSCNLNKNNMYISPKWISFQLFDQLLFSAANLAVAWFPLTNALGENLPSRYLNMFKLTPL